MESKDQALRILKMYEVLRKGKEVQKRLFCAEYGISGRTFDRDIEKIRLFLSEEYSGEDVQYHLERGSYRIPGSGEGGSLSLLELQMVVKILKSERVLEKGEFEGLMMSLQSAAEKGDREEAKKFILNETGQYEEKTGQGAFMKLFGDLLKCISDQNIIRLKLKEKRGEQSRVKFFPVAVEYQFSGFYLLGYRQENEEELIAFGLDEIESFQMTLQKYGNEVLERYSYQEGIDLLKNLEEQRRRD